MASSVVVTIKSSRTQSDLQRMLQLATNQDKEGVQALAGYLKEVLGGISRAVVDVQTGSAAPVAASGTLTLTSAVATDAITIGTVTLTASSTPADEDEWEIDGGSDTADATALAAAINAHSVLSQIVTATSEDEVVTITAKQKGVVGNHINLSSADATIVASGTHLSGGTGGVTEAATTYTLGI